MERLDVSILGRDYSLACAPEQKPALLQAVAHVDRCMQRVRASSKSATSTERVAVMAALQMASELLELRMPSSGGSQAELAVGDYKRRIEDMQRVVDGALGKQDTLF
jgi:cell division protein ZapA